jgi:hypothetical protein
MTRPTRIVVRHSLQDAHEMKAEGPTVCLHVSHRERLGEF